VKAKDLGTAEMKIKAIRSMEGIHRNAHKNNANINLRKTTNIVDDQIIAGRN